MKEKKILTLLLAAGVCMSVMSCGMDKGTPSEESSAARENQELSLRIAWWGNQERHNATIAVLDAFADRTGMDFSYEYTSWISYLDNLSTQAVGSNLPDILQMSTTEITQYYQKGLLIDLQDYVRDGIIDTSDMEPDSLNGGLVDGELAGITTGVNTVCIAYNKEIFDQARVSYPKDDWTWEQFLLTAKTIYERTGIQTEIPFLSEPKWAIEAMVRSYGYDFFSADGSSLPWAEDQKVVTALANTIRNIYGGVRSGYLVDPKIQISWSTTEDSYLARGKAAMSCLLSNYYTAFCQGSGQELGLCAIPKMGGTNQSGLYLNPNMYWCISVNCEHPQAAAEVINYLINDAQAAEITGTDRGIPLSQSLRALLAASENTDTDTRNVLDFVNGISTLVETPNLADSVNSTEIAGLLKENYIAVMYGEQTARKCMENFLSQASSILKKETGHE